jgi:hypothetical protein
MFKELRECGLISPGSKPTPGLKSGDFELKSVDASDA